MLQRGAELLFRNLLQQVLLFRKVLQRGRDLLWRKVLRRAADLLWREVLYLVKSNLFEERMLRIRGCLLRKVLQCGRRVRQGPLQESHQSQLPVAVAALGLQAVSWAVDLTVPLGRSMASRRQSWLNRLPYDSGAAPEPVNSGAGCRPSAPGD